MCKCIILLDPNQLYHKIWEINEISYPVRSKCSATTALWGTIIPWKCPATLECLYIAMRDWPGEKGRCWGLCKASIKCGWGCCGAKCTLGKCWPEYSPLATIWGGGAPLCCMLGCMPRGPYGKMGCGWVEVWCRAVALWLSRSKISFGLSDRSEGSSILACLAGLPSSLFSNTLLLDPSGKGLGDIKLPTDPSEPCGDMLLSLCRPLKLPTDGDG